MLISGAILLLLASIAVMAMTPSLRRVAWPFALLLIPFLIAVVVRR